MPKRQPKKTFSWIAAILLAGTAALLWRLGVPILYAYLVAINAVTVLLYGYDKRQAIAAGSRVPELILHLIALLGGSPGALLAQALFRHKTKKFAFRAGFVGILVLQLLVAFGYWYLVLRTA